MFKYYYFRLMEKISERLHIFRIVNTSVGYKLINVGLFSNFKTSNSKNDGIVDKQVVVHPEKLFLGLDFLKNSCTLLGCNIIQSPHYGLIEALAHGTDINKTDYIKRSKNGTLDARYPVIVRDSSFFYRKFDTMKNKLDNNEIEPITVFRVDDVYYIKDGKHRAALCAYYKRPIECIIIDSYKMVGTIGNAVAGLMKSKSEYTKQFDFYNKLNTRK